MRDYESDYEEAAKRGIRKAERLVGQMLPRSQAFAIYAYASKVRHPNQAYQHALRSALAALESSK